MGIKKTVNKATTELTGRELLAALAVKYEGDFVTMFNAVKNKEEFNAEERKKFLSKIKGYNYITILDDEYPESLKKIYQPPLVLFYKGDISLINKEKIVGVVGTRSISAYGKKVTNDIVGGFVKVNKDVPIVTGLSTGVATEAAGAAMAVKGKTIIVMMSGIQNVYPTQSKAIYDKADLVIGEYPGTVAPNKDTGMMRNRIIAGLSSKLLVTESRMNSGSNITVMFALSQGKDVLAVPCNIDAVNNITNKLIQDGAIAIMNADDVDYMMK